MADDIDGSTHPSAADPAHASPSPEADLETEADMTAAAHVVASGARLEPGDHHLVDDWCAAKQLPRRSADEAGLRAAIRTTPTGSRHPVVAVDVRDHLGDIIGWQWTSPVTEWQPRTDGRGCVCWRTLRTEQPDIVLIAEGLSDHVAAHQLPVGWIVGSVGAGQMARAAGMTVAAMQRRNLVATPVVIAADGDCPGRAAALRAADICRRAGQPVAVLAMPDGIDLRDAIRMLDRDLAAAWIATAAEAARQPGGCAVAMPEHPDTLRALRDAQPPPRHTARHTGRKPLSGDTRPAQADLVRILEARGARRAGWPRGGEWRGSCPTIDGCGCGAGHDRLHVAPDGLLGCRRCPDGGRALWAAAVGPATAS